MRRSFVSKLCAQGTLAAAVCIERFPSAPSLSLVFSCSFSTVGDAVRLHQHRNPCTDASMYAHRFVHIECHAKYNLEVPVHIMYDERPEHSPSPRKLCSIVFSHTPAPAMPRIVSMAEQLGCVYLCLDIGSIELCMDIFAAISRARDCAWMHWPLRFHYFVKRPA